MSNVGRIVLMSFAANTKGFSNKFGSIPVKGFTSPTFQQNSTWCLADKRNLLILHGS